MVWATDVSNNLFGNGSQSGYVEKLSDVGPNGGKVFRVVISAIMPSGSVRSRFLYSTGMNVNTESVIIHSAQYETAIETATGYQQTFGGYDVYEPGYNQVYWLDYDVVDDVLVSTNPDLGTNVTRARATIGGAVIEQGVTLSANLNHISKAFLALGRHSFGQFSNTFAVMYPTALLVRFWPEFGYRFPESQRTITNSQFRCILKTSLLQID